MEKDTGDDENYGDHPIDRDRYHFMAANEVPDIEPVETLTELQVLIRDLKRRANPAENEIPSMDMEGDLMAYNGTKNDDMGDSE
jgi:hypothetical protein